MNDQLPINKLVLGKIGAAYGIDGWMNLFSFTEKKKIFLSINHGFFNMKNIGNV